MRASLLARVAAAVAAVTVGLAALAALPATATATAWAGQAGPAGTGYRAVGGLSGVAAASAGNAWAVWLRGHRLERQGPHAALERDVMDAGDEPEDPDGTAGELSAITVVSARDAWAVGTTGGSPRSRPCAALLHWNGKAWSQVTSVAAIGGALSGSRPRQRGWAVGADLTPSVVAPLLLHWNGKAWSRVEHQAEPRQPVRERPGPGSR